MDDTSDYRRGRSVVYALHVHLVFVTKYRRRVLDEAATATLRTIFARVCEDFGAELRACDGEDDHVHLLVEYPPTVLLPTLVNSLKGVSSRRLKQEFPAINAFWSVRKSRGVLWTPSYFAGSVGGAPLSVLKQYIKNQGLS